MAVNNIDKAIRYVYADEDSGYWRKNLPKNVIPFIFKKPFKQEIDEMEKEREKLEKDKQTKKPIKRYASVNPEALAFEFWWDRWQEHELRDKFKTLESFVSWSLANEDQLFHRGGRVGIASIETPLYKAVKSGKVGLQFVPPRKKNLT
tara:strand:+ start:154 stop:597 length:444 start_codon:yes stop_codon:yes gene_type:complete